MQTVIDTEGKRRKATINFCEQCGKSYLVPSRFASKQKFCSILCRSLARKTAKVVKCDYCGESFFLRESRKKISKSGYHFCSRSCKDEAQRIENKFYEMFPIIVSNRTRLNASNRGKSELHRATNWVKAQAQACDD